MSTGWMWLWAEDRRDDGSVLRLGVADDGLTSAEELLKKDHPNATVLVKCAYEEREAHRPWKEDSR
jgi:hypothetical protein